MTSPVTERSSFDQGKESCTGQDQPHSQEKESHIMSSSSAREEEIRFYCGVGSKYWDHHTVVPGPYVCIAPVCGRTASTQMLNYVSLPDDVEAVLMDSSAFSDKTRLSFEEARNRQIAHAYRFGYVEKVSHIASYDQLIDEKWQDGERSKQRWCRVEAEAAVKETVKAARYLASQRKRLHGVFGHRVGLALSAQGVEPDQYLRCTQQIVACMEPEDLFGLGGWCITGLFPHAILPSFCEIVSVVVPYLGSQGVKQVHIWGVIFPEALGYLLFLCDQYGIRLSTDSSGPYRYPRLGQWGYGSWRDNTYERASILSSCKVTTDGKKTPTCTPETRCLGQERIRHVALTRQWLARFREREPRLCRPAHWQPSLFQSDGESRSPTGVEEVCST